MDKFIVLNRIEQTKKRAAKAGQHLPVKKWAVIRLLEHQPIAVGIRFEGRCHCKGKFLMSYLHPDYIHSRKEGHEDCGYYCPSCGFSNVGSREVWTRKFGNSRASAR